MSALYVLALMFAMLAVLLLLVCAGAMLGLTAYRFAAHSPFDEEDFAIGGAIALPVLVVLALMVSGVIA